MALAAEEHGREIVEVYLQAMRKGDWRAAEVLMSRIYGEPEEAMRQVEVNLATAVLKSMSLEEKLELLHNVRRGEPIALPVVEAVPPTNRLVRTRTRARLPPQVRHRAGPIVTARRSVRRLRRLRPPRPAVRLGKGWRPSPPGLGDRHRAGVRLRAGRSQYHCGDAGSPIARRKALGSGRHGTGQDQGRDGR